MAALSLAAGCEQPEPEHLPDRVLQRELGLDGDDRVHTIRIAGGVAETANPALDSVPTGVLVEFVTTDWFVHEVVFEVDSMGSAARLFMEGLDQVASPPLLYRDSRFVVSFEGAPAGRYPFRLEGNGAPGRGVVIVTASEGR